MTIGEAHRCPPSEELAAFVDAKLPRAQVVPLTEHLADCAECRYLVESAAESEPATRTKSWQWMSIAAAIVLAVILTPFARRTWEIRQRDTAVRELAAMKPGAERLIDPRVTGGFVYAPIRHNRGSGDDENTDRQQMIFQGKAADVVERTEHDRTPAGRHARGVAELMLKDASALNDLTEATKLHPNDASAWSDLAAARYVAGDYAGAHAAAERAIQLNPKLDEAWFNRALASNAIDEKRAVVEWNEYLKHDPSSRWAEEAKDHIDTLKP
jgi:tetratricopeptide (TPR) repeat protein